MNLDGIILVALLMAFILPSLAIVTSTLPPPSALPGAANTSVNVTTLLNSTGFLVSNQITGVYGSLNTQLLGNGKGSFFADPSIVSAFAFIVQGLGAIMTTFIQIPQIDYASMRIMITGLGTVLPIAVVDILEVGASLLNIYMSISLLLLGLSMIQKYNISGTTS